MAFSKQHGLPDTVRLLEAMRFKFGVDFDGSLTWEAPQFIPVGKLVALVHEHQAEIAQHLIGREQWNRMRCYGGPLDGRRHGWYYRHLPLYDEQMKFVRYLNNFEAVRVERAKWAIYRLERDRRAFFVGYATSKANARQGKANWREKPTADSKEGPKP